MLYPFFVRTARSPAGGRVFRQAVVAHVIVLAFAAGAVALRYAPLPILGHTLLVVGVVEGAAFVGWRLTQLPQGRSLELLLVTVWPSRGVLAAEALVGLCRLALVTFAGLPVLVLLVAHGVLEAADVPVLLGMPFTWGAVTGLGLAAWAFEPRAVRQTAERAVLTLAVTYIGFGVLVGERLRDLLARPPAGPLRWLVEAFAAFHRGNPFAVLESWLVDGAAVAGGRFAELEIVAVAAGLLALARAACRLRGHFEEWHFGPVRDPRRGRRGRIGGRPLSWWAVRRVSQYAGRVNVALAAGFAAAYALHTVAGPHWPAGLGRGVFDFCDRVGGVRLLATGLVLLAAVPAAFQYGLWDGSAAARRRRLELLLLTRLDGRDYWDAAAAAAWRRGRGYFAAAGLLWLAGAAGGRLGLTEAGGALAAAVVLWGLYFLAGFLAFSRGVPAHGLGLLLTIGLPLLTYACFRVCGAWATLLPPGAVYAPVPDGGAALGLAGSLTGGVTVLALAPLARARCDGSLRCWYRRHAGLPGAV
jgi:hypothetical protein